MCVIRSLVFVCQCEFKCPIHPPAPFFAFIELVLRFMAAAACFLLFAPPPPATGDEPADRVCCCCCLPPATFNVLSLLPKP